MRKIKNIILILIFLIGSIFARTSQIVHSLIDTTVNVMELESSIEKVTVSDSVPSLLVIYKGKYGEFDHWNIIENILYSELQSKSDMFVIPQEELGTVFNGCLTDSCINDMGSSLMADQILLWTLNQKRDVLKLEMTLLTIEKKRLERIVSYYQNEPSEIKKGIRQDCLKLFNKKESADLFGKRRLNELGLMVEYHIGKDKALIGVSAASAVGLLAILLQEEDKGPGIGQPPNWPGE